MLKKIFRSSLLAILAIFMVAGIALAATYYAEITVDETNGTDYTNLPIIVAVDNDYLASKDYILSTGLDTRILLDGAEIPHLVVDDQVLFVADIDGNSENSFLYTFGNSTLADMPIITGDGGYITTTDASILELGSCFEVILDGYFDTSSGSNKDLLYKQDAFRIYVQSAGVIRAAFLGSGDTETVYVDANVTSGIHEIKVTADYNDLKIYEDTIEEDSASIAPDEGNSVVDATISTAGNSYSRHTFYSDGRWWIFWADNVATTGYFSSSTDGTSWETPTSIGSAANSNMVVSWFDGTYVHYARKDYSTDDLMYRRGDPETNGTITWSAAEQTVIADIYSLGSISADSSSYPFITYVRINGSASCWVTKSSANDGTWSTAGSFPYEINDEGDREATIFPLIGASEMYLVHEGSGAAATDMKGRLWNGSNWESEEDIGAETYTSQWSALPDNNGDVHFIYLYYGDTPKYYRHIVRDYSSDTWGSINEVFNDTGTFSLASAYDSANDIVYMIVNDHSSGDGLSYCRYANGSWVDSSPVDLVSFTESASGLVCSPSSYASSGEGHSFGLAYIIDGDLQHSTIDLDPTGVIDTANDYILLRNDVSPYTDYITFEIPDNTDVLWYQPVDIIATTVLPDRQGSAQNGAITWGSNPAGITVGIGGIVSYSQPSPYDIPEESAHDIVGEMSQPGWTVATGNLVDNPIYPLIKAIADNTDFTVPQLWIGLATFIVVGSMLAAFSFVPHQLITVFVGGTFAGISVALGIYPFWVMYIFVLAGITAVLWERTPAV